MSAAIEPFRLAVPQAELDRLGRRLAETRWPDPETVDDWSQGAPLAAVRRLVEHWRTAYDWRRCEAMLNGFGQHRTVIDGLGIHFLHVRSPHAGALPLLITHGWPGSVIEFHKVIGPLVDPPAHGGDAADAFHVVAPTLPGYGFSDRPVGTGWTVARIAVGWDVLMQRLGYARYVAQGGDWGAIVTSDMGRLAPAGLAAIHLNMPIVGPADPDTAPEEERRAARAAAARFGRGESAYAMLQATKPQTLGYGLADSPVGQAAWIYEKFHGWTDCDGDPESVLGRDEMLDNIMLYWLTNSGASSARLYWESLALAGRPVRIDIPVGCSIFPKEIGQPPRAWAEHWFGDLIYWNTLDRGGHFAAFEQPAPFVEELRNCFRLVR